MDQIGYDVITPSFRCIRLWNQLLEDLVTAPSLIAFKEGLQRQTSNNEDRKYELHAVQVHLKYDIDISLWCSVIKGTLVQKFYESRQTVHMGVADVVIQLYSRQLPVRQFPFHCMGAFICILLCQILFRGYFMIRCYVLKQTICTQTRL